MQSISVYGVVGGLYVSPKNDALKHPRACGKWCANLSTDTSVLRRFVTYAVKLDKYLKSGGALWAEHHKPAGGFQQFKGAAGHIVTADYNTGEVGNYTVRRALELAGENCPMCKEDHSGTANQTTSAQTASVPMSVTNNNSKEDEAMKKYAAVEIKNDNLTYLGLFDTLAGAKDRAAGIAGAPVKLALTPVAFTGGIVLAGAHSELLKRYDRGDYKDVSAVADNPPIEVQETPIEVQEPAAPAPAPAAAPAAVTRVINSGEGLNVKDRAALIAPAISDAMYAATPPVFLKLSHYTATNKLHISVTGSALTLVVIDATGVVCNIAGAPVVTVSDDVVAATTKLLKAMRPINKAVNAGAVTLTPAGMVAKNELVAA